MTCDNGNERPDAGRSATVYGIQFLMDADSNHRRPVYLDYAATTPVDPDIIGSMTRYLGPEGVFGNAASRIHWFGEQASEAVERAREQVAMLLNAEPAEIVWTSGATESINLAIKGVALSRASRGKHLIVSCMEHKAVLDTCTELERTGFEITRLEPDTHGLITVDSVREALRVDTILVSLMHANNEVGTITDIRSIGELAENAGVLFHVDAAQTAGRLNLDMHEIKADLVSFSGHKMYGPKGVGVLYVRRRQRHLRLQPQIHGGGHQDGLRSGTLATHQIVGMGEAARIVKIRHSKDLESIERLEKNLLARLAVVQDVYINGNQDNRVPGIASISFLGVTNDSLLLLLRQAVAISSGSACTTATRQPSHVLQALSIPQEHARSAVRISIGRFTTPADIEFAAGAICTAVVELRRLRNPSQLIDSRSPSSPPAPPRHPPLAQVLGGSIK